MATHSWSGSCLENSMDRGAWWVTVYAVAKSQTRVSDFQFHCVNRYSLCMPRRICESETLGNKQINKPCPHGRSDG